MTKTYYKINLNKISNRLDQFQVKQKRRRVFALGFYFFVIMIITALAIGKSIHTQRTINGLKSELAEIQSEIDQLEASSDYLSPEDIFALAELANTRLTWTEKFDVLGKIMPKDVTITGLNYDYQVKTLMIKGISKVNPQLEDLDLVVSIINLIKANNNFSSDFNDIKFHSSNRIKHKEQDIVEFEIACLVGVS
jgi:Tfp pilus assembly protein PilN